MASTFPTYVALILISLLSLSPSDSDPIEHKSNAVINGFTAHLIHRDSPQSPSYDPSLTPSQRIANAIRRSLHRVQRFASMQSEVSPLSEIFNSGGEYLMKYSIGSPPVPSLGIADTGSDIIWTQCQPCLQCFNQTLPVFNPKKSSTYKKIRCSAAICKNTPQSYCGNGTSGCGYTESYGDGSFTEGDLARETITLASVSVPKVVIGCGTSNGGVFTGGESGIVGLGGGELSLVSQLGPLAGGKFSYCLVPFSGKPENSSKLSFGTNAVVSGTGVVSTPLIRKEGYSYYFTTLLGISFGNQRFDFFGPLGSELVQEGNILVDSGTTLTILPSGLYEKLKEAIQTTIKLRQVPDPMGFLELCFETRSDDVRIPDITVHFKGADLKWKVENVIVRVSDKVVCLAVRTAGDLAIYGSFAQINYMVGFDLLKKTVSFKPTDCGMV